MKRIFARFGAAVALTLLALVSPALAAGNGTAPTLTVESTGGGEILAKDSGPAGPALWKVADEDTTIYLFGTVHALPGGIPWFDGKIANALHEADEFVTEVDLSLEADLQAGMTRKGLLPAGKTLRGLMGPQDRKAYEDGMAGIGLPPGIFDRFEPWFAGLTLSMMPLLQEGYSAASGVEAVLAARLGPDTRRGALETVDFQLDLFDTLPLDTQIAYLRHSVETAPQAVAMLDKMVAEWLEGDAEALAELVNDEGNDPELLERLLFARNRQWAGWIDDRLDRPGTVFLAVGAGHLSGKGSVQDVLANEGIVTIRVQ